MEKEKEILDSWLKNADNWIQTIAQQDIPSRKQATNRAIVEAVLATKARRVLDAGCGEGWLSRALAGEGMDVVGIDGVPGLIEYARQRGGAAYFCLSYEELVAGQGAQLGLFDAIVFNFSLFGKELTRALLQKLRQHLAPEGKLVIQTLHADFASELDMAEDGWVKEDWKGMKRAFRQPYRWYFRDRAAWNALFAEAGFQLLSETEVALPDTGRPVSMIFTAMPEGLNA